MANGFNNINKMLKLNKADAQEQTQQAFAPVQQKAQEAADATRLTGDEGYQPDATEKKEAIGRQVGAADTGVQGALANPNALIQKNVNQQQGYGEGAQGLDSLLTNSASKQATQQLSSQFGNLRGMLQAKQGALQTGSDQWNADAASRQAQEKQGFIDQYSKGLAGAGGAYSSTSNYLTPQQATGRQAAGIGTNDIMQYASQVAGSDLSHPFDVVEVDEHNGKMTHRTTLNELFVAADKRNGWPSGTAERAYMVKYRGGA